MENNNSLLRRDLDDIVFENRNRAYGAYSLRKSYGHHIRNASFMGLAAFLILVSSPLIAEKVKFNTVPLVMSPDVLLPPPAIDPNTPPPLPPPPKAPVEVPQIATQKFLPPRVLEDEKVVVLEDMPKMDDIKDAVSTVTKDGIHAENNMVLDVPTVLAPPDEGLKVAVPKDDETVFRIVEQNPMFKDGEGAMFRFLNENIKYPFAAKENGIEGVVYVNFTVSKDGSIRDVKALRGIGGGCIDEALRVVAMMPAWMPGKQNGKAVNVSFTIPIKFKLD